MKPWLNVFSIRSARGNPVQVINICTFFFFNLMLKNPINSLSPTGIVNTLELFETSLS